MRHHEETIAAYVAKVADEPEVLALVVVGSVARATERSTSDVDVYLVVTDEAYTAAGASIGDPWAADVVVKVAPPTTEEIGRLRSGTVLIGFLAPLSDVAVRLPTRRSKRKPTLAIACLLAALVVVACGDGSVETDRGKTLTMWP